MKKIIFTFFIIAISVALAGIYKFNYLSSQEGYDVDGNAIPPDNLPQAENCAADGVGCEQFNPDKPTPKALKPQIITSVSPAEFKALAETGSSIIIDIRTPKELLPENGGPLFDKALNIDFYAPDFKEKLKQLDPNEKYLIYCRSGNRTNQALEIMKDLGFENVTDLAGGRKAWLKTFPDEDKSSTKTSQNTIKGRSMSSMMNHENLGDKFSKSTERLPDVIPTELVKLKDGDTFEMTAEMVKQEMGNRVIKRLAYNRMIPGPIIQVEKNARIKIKFTNKLDVETTLHSHGLRIDDDFDGVPIGMGGKQKNMKPGESFTYELTFPDIGVFWYHPHIREDYTQEMGLYGNFSVQGRGYWNSVHREEFLVLDDFSENDPFYKDLTNKTLMGRFGNILLINNQENFQMKAKRGEVIRFFVTNTANTRTFDFSIMNVGVKNISPLKIVGGDIGRVEKEYLAGNFIIAPAERIIFEATFKKPGIYEIQHRGKKIGEIAVSDETVAPFYAEPLSVYPEQTPLNLIEEWEKLRKNLTDYAIIRDKTSSPDLGHGLIEKIPDKHLRLSIGMKNMGEIKMGMNHKNGMGKMMGGMPKDMDMKDKVNGEAREDALGQASLGGVRHMEEDGGIEWEDDMAQMNKMSNNGMMEWMIIDETDPQNPKKNIEMNEAWKFKKGQMVKVEIYNDPKSMHPMQHPIHFHGQRFVVLTRDGKPNENLQWKDTVLVKTGEKIEILLEMSNPGKWIAHCHIAEHMHAGMMFNFEVE